MNKLKFSSQKKLIKNLTKKNYFKINYNFKLNNNFLKVVSGTTLISLPIITRNYNINAESKYDFEGGFKKEVIKEGDGKNFPEKGQKVT
jgi:hypothetical protein